MLLWARTRVGCAGSHKDGVDLNLLRLSGMALRFTI